MITKKYSWIILPLVFLTFKVFAQPYFYFNGPDSTKFWRFNLQNGVKELFITNTVNPGGNVSWNPNQHWMYINTDNSYNRRDLGADEYYILINAINASNSTIAHTFPDQYTHPAQTSPNSFFSGEGPRGKMYDGIFYNPIKNIFYVTWFLPHPDSLGSWIELSPYQRTAAYNASTFAVLDTLPVPPGWITSLSSVSDDGNYLYVENVNSSNDRVNAIGKYSLLTKQFVLRRNLSDINVPGGYNVEDSKKGNYLISFLYPRKQMEDTKYGVYNIDRDSVYGLIPFPLSSDGYLSSDGKYVVIEEVSWIIEKKTWGNDYVAQRPGRISVFNGLTGSLIQKLTLPPDGKVLVFDNYPNMLYYYLPGEQRSINIDLSKLTPPLGLNVKLVNSTGTKLTGGSLQYYDGSWKDGVNNNDGTFFVNTSAKTLSLRMTYEYGTQTKSNVTVGYDTVAFQTVNAQIQLQNSSGVLIDTGSVQYYAGAWRTLGTTINGTATKELLPSSYSFRMTYAYASKDKQQDITTNATVVFQTVNATVQLQNSLGALIDQGTVQYYSGAWRDLGTTTNGVATKELLPNNYSFRMTYAYASKDKQQDISTNATVVFQTVNAAIQLQNSQGVLMDQ